MKYPTRLLSLLILVSATVFFSNCGGDDAPGKTEQEIQFEKLKFTWTLESVIADNSAAAAQFTNGELTLSGNFKDGGEFTYSLKASSPDGVEVSPWPATGSFKFGTPVSSSIIRLDSKLDGSPADVTMSYFLSSDGKTLTVGISAYSGPEYYVGGRSASVDGDWEFTFTRP